MKEVGRRVYSEFDDDNLLDGAAALAYYFFFALFPMIMVLITLLGIFGGQSLGNTLVDEINGGKVQTLMILGGNPVYSAPADLNFGVQGVGHSDHVIAVGGEQLLHQRHDVLIVIDYQNARRRAAG